MQMYNLKNYGVKTHGSITCFKKQNFTSSLEASPHVCLSPSPLRGRRHFEFCVSPLLVFTVLLYLCCVNIQCNAFCLDIIEVHFAHCMCMSQSSLFIHSPAAGHVDSFQDFFFFNIFY